MNEPLACIPSTVNTGSWLVGYTLNELRERIANTRVVLPICSLGTRWDQLSELAPLVLPPLYHEALESDSQLKTELLERIQHCFPYYAPTRDRKERAFEFEIVELPAKRHTATVNPRILAFSVDTAVEEHGPHLPLATDTIQSYAVLDRLANEFDGFVAGPAVEYGHLTWGLPFGLSIDITPPLLTRYVTGFANAVLDWLSPDALYVVDVHGSPVHRQAIQDGLSASRARRFAFRWLHEPLVEFAGERGDQHAGGVETALVHFISENLTDSRWWPDRVETLAAEQMSLEQAVELTPDLSRFIAHVEAGRCNGIVGDIRNFFDVDPAVMMDRMLETARADVGQLLGAK